MAAALVFLEINDFPVMGGEKEGELATPKLASGAIEKKTFAKVLEKTYKKFQAIAKKGK